LRKLALLVLACPLLFLANRASAQRGDILVGASTLLSPSPVAGVLNFQQPAEKNGTYVSIGGDVVGFAKHRHLGINFETAWRTKKAVYPYTGETYRPVFTDVNALFQSRLGPKVVLDLFAGVGVASTRFYIPPSNSCGIAAGGCVNYTNSNHFMEDLGAGVRYYPWRHIFVRPEIHYYHIQNNVEFHSPNVFRAGASIGYTIGAK